MAKIKLTKTELKAQTDALRRFMRFLPMLHLKKQQLQAEIAGITAKIEAVSSKEESVLASIAPWTGLFAAEGAALDGIVKVKEIRVSSANVAGVEIPVFEGIETATGETDLWNTPAWHDDAIPAMVSILSLRAERKTLERQRELVSAELATTSQRVNLFEKVKIPACRENIRVIKIAIGDAQTAAVTRGKIAKSRQPQQGGEKEDAA